MKRFLHITFILLFACSGSEGEVNVEVVKVYDLKENEVDFLDMMVDPQVIPLETQEKSLISERIRLLLGESYIVTVGANEILLFDRKGRFIRKVASSGNGPGEFNNVADCDLSFDGERLLFTEYGQKQILEFDLQQSSYNVIPVPETVSEIIPLADNQLLAIPTSSSKNQYFTIDTNTEEILSAGLKNSSTESYVGRPVFLSKTRSDDLFFFPIESDMLYQFQNGMMTPVMFFEVSDNQDQEASGISLRVIEVTEEFMLLYKMDDRTRTAGSIFLDRRSKNAFRYKVESGLLNSMLFSNDEIGFVIGPEYFGAEPDDRAEIEEELIALVEKKGITISPEDNPILIIGKIKMSL